MVLVWHGDDPLGTPGGIETLDTPSDAPDIREAFGQVCTYFLLVNGPIDIRDRAAIERVIRTIGARGEYTMGLILQDDGTNVDSNVTTINTGAGIQTTQVSPGVVLMEVGTGFITSAMLADAIVTASKLAAGAVGTAALADAAVTPAKLSQPYVGHPPLTGNSGLTGTLPIDFTAGTTTNRTPFTITGVPSLQYLAISFQWIEAQGLNGVSCDLHMNTVIQGSTYSNLNMRFEGGVNSRGIYFVPVIVTANPSTGAVTFDSNYTWVAGSVEIVSGYHNGVLIPLPG